MTQEQNIAQLAVKYITDTLTEQERSELEQWFQASPENRGLFDKYTHPGYLGNEYEKRLGRKERLEARMEDVVAGKVSDVDRDLSAGVAAPLIFGEEKNTPFIAHRIHFLKTSWFRYAAAILALLGGVIVWLEIARSARNKSGISDQVAKNQDIPAGTNKAFLTIGDSTINLSNHKTGITIGNAVTYNDGERIADAGNVMTLSIPRGGQYQAVLPDGSKVWLNAASSIQFSSKMNEGPRNVTVKGEVYIEVAQNSRHPFFVKTPKTLIQVLGTGFNINAYEGELEKTTLLEGRVRVSLPAADPSGHRDQPGDVVLQPGQQVQVSPVDNTVYVDDKADLERVMAWKNGMFQFKGATVEEVMRQLSRWYDLDVVYEGKPPVTRFEGEMQRDLPLSSALRILELSKVHFRIEGKKLIVLP